jgi:hypothetical protein
MKVGRKHSICKSDSIANFFQPRGIVDPLSSKPTLSSQHLVSTSTARNPLYIALCFLFSEMDFSQFNAAEQAHMSKVVEKQQVLSSMLRSDESVADVLFEDARLCADVRESCRPMFQLMLQ